MAQSKEKFTFTWKIENFSMLPHRLGDFLKSPTFVFEALGNSKWCLWLYPKGHCSNESDDYLSLYLSRDDLDTNSDSLKIGLVLAIESTNIAFNKYVGAPSTSIDFDNDSKGWPKFQSLNLLNRHKKDYLPQDILTILCSVWSSEGDGTADINFGIVRGPSARTRIKAHRRTLTWSITKVSELKKNREKISIDSVNSLEDSPAIKITLCIDQDLNSEYAQIEILRTRYLRDEQGLFVKCKMTVVTSNKECQHSFEDCHWFGADLDEIWHFPELILLDNIIDDKYIYVDDTMFLQCEFSFSCKDSEYHVEIPTYMCNAFKVKEALNPETTLLSSNMRRLFVREQFCDVEVRAGEKAFPCHKVVLCAQSPVFSAMFENDMREKETGVVEIADLDTRTLERILTFLYLETIDDGLSVEELCELYSAADKYEIVTLQRRCSLSLLSALTSASVCRVLYIADSHQDNFLWTHAYKFLNVYSRYIFHSPQWKAFMVDHPTLARETMIKICIEEPCS